MKWIIGLVALCLSFSTSATAQSVNSLQHYQVMQFPRASIPLGARWLAGSGPDGPATSTENVEVLDGGATQNVVHELQQSIGVSLGGMIGLTRNQSQRLRVNLTDVRTHRVKDITALRGLTAGQAYIAEAISAGRISITADDETISMLRARLPVSSLPPELGEVNVDAEARDRRSTTLNIAGENLFVAYRLNELTPGRRRTVAQNYVGEPLLLNGWTFRFCPCAEVEGNIRVIVTDDTSILTDGNVPRIQRDFRPQGLQFLEFDLPVRRVRNDLIRTSARIRYFRTEPCFNVAGSTRGCYPRGMNSVELTTTTFQLRPFRDRRSPY